MTFAGAALRMQDSVFSKGGSPAKWKSGGVGDGVDCRVIKAEPDTTIRYGQDRAIMPTAMVRVRRSEVDAPAEDDTVDIYGDDGVTLVVTLKIIAEPMLEKHRSVYTCEAVRA
jgi:hypothetical protein